MARFWSLIRFSVGYLYTLILEGGDYGRIFGVFFDLVFGYLYTLTLGGGNYGRILGVFFDSVFGFLCALISVYLYTRFLGGGNSGRIFGVFFSRFGVWISLHTDWGGELWAHF